MRKCSLIIIELLVLCYVLLTCCDTKRSYEYVKSAPDTCYTTVVYAFNLQANEYRTTTAMKVILDTFALTAVDSLTSVKKLRRDSVYWLPFVDTVKNNGRPVVDSLGKPKRQVRWTICPPELIMIDYNKRWR